MDKQQFDHIENRIRQAAEEVSVAFNEEAWAKMEVKLDNEFNKNRRRGGTWWWFSLLLLIIAGSGIYFYSSRPSVPSAKNPVRQSAPATVQSSAENNPDPTVAKRESNTGDNMSQAQLEKVTQSTLSGNIKNNLKQPVGNMVHLQSKGRRMVTPVNPDPADGKVVSNALPGNKLTKNTTKTSSDGTHANAYANRDELLRAGKSKDKAVDPVQTDVSLNETGNITPGITSPVDTSQKKAAADTKAAEQPVKQDSIEDKDISSKKIVAKKPADMPSKGFYFIGSVAADATSLNSISTKNIKPEYGIGVGYRFSKRFSVQTGFYAGKKIYSAGPDDYKVNPGSYIAKIISAEAICNIYDIPLTLRYDILQRKKKNIYFTTGFSSLILKREIYDMHFYNPTGTYRHMSYTYNDNKNFLSILNFSAGVEQKLSDAFYVQAEPYIKLPLTGVGEGKVKLYSAGIQLGIKYQPLKRRK